MTLPAPTTLPTRKPGFATKPEGPVRLFIREVSTDGESGATYLYPTALKSVSSQSAAWLASLGVKVSTRTHTADGEVAPEGCRWLYVTRLPR